MNCLCLSCCPKERCYMEEFEEKHAGVCARFSSRSSYILPSLGEMGKNMTEYHFLFKFNERPLEAFNLGK